MSIEKAYAYLRGFGLENRVQEFNVSRRAAQTLNVARRAKIWINVCKLSEALS